MTRSISPMLRKIYNRGAVRIIKLNRTESWQLCRAFEAHHEYLARSILKNNLDALRKEVSAKSEKYSLEEGLLPLNLLNL
jgi:hypothetical protein